MDPTLEAVLNGTHRADLTAEQEQQLADYLETAEGQAALAGLEDDLGQAAGYLEPPELPESAWARVHEAVRGLGPVGAAAPPSKVIPLPQPVQRPEPSQLPKLIALAAAVLLVVGVGVFLPLDVLLGPNGADTVSSLDDQPAPSPPGPPIVVSLEAGPGYVVKPYTDDDLLVFHVSPKD